MTSPRADVRIVDRTAGWLGVAFLVTLLGSEAALSLPDEAATDAFVTTFYSQHRTVIIALQIVGFVSAALLAVFAWRLRVVSRGVAAAGILLALAALAPGIITALIAIVADPAHPDAAGRYNQLEPRADDLLFLGVMVFAATITYLIGRSPLWLGMLSSTVSLLCLLRFALEALLPTRNVLDSLAPIAFLVLIAGLVVLCFRGFPEPERIV
jgi:hypothetical protein